MQPLRAGGHLRGGGYPPALCGQSGGPWASPREMKVAVGMERSKHFPETGVKSGVFSSGGRRCGCPAHVPQPFTASCILSRNFLCSSQHLPFCQTPFTASTSFACTQESRTAWASTPARSLPLPVTGRAGKTSPPRWPDQVPRGVALTALA